jgi:hypothetical protein
MKKITLWLFALFGCWQINAQVNLVQNFNGGTVLPAGWTETGGKTIAATESCEGNSIRDNLYSFSATGTLVSPNQVGASNGTDLTFSFDYKIEDWSSTVPTPAGWGNFTVDYSTDNGTTWITFFTVNDANHVVANTCATFTNVIPAASLPTGSDFRFRFNMTWASGDYDIYFDNISATQVSTIAPDCTTLITPADGAVNVTSSVISWSVPTGIPDGYYLTVGTTSGGNDILDNFDVGNVTSYNIGALVGSTTYYVTIIPYNSIGDAIGCTETSFSSCFINVAPWTYDVETAAATTNSTIADCWSSNPTGTTSAFRWDVDASGGTPSGTSTGPSGANSGVKYFYTEASSGATGAVAELYTPLVDLSALADPTLQFYYHMRGVNMGSLHIDVFDGTTWTNDVLVISGPQQTAASDPWTLSIVSLNAFSGSTIQVRFRGIRGAGFESDMSLDDISFEEAPSCFDPINLGATNITADSFDLLFTDASGGNQFDFNYVVQPQGTGAPATFPAGDYEDGSNTLDGTNYIIPVSGLTPNTSYEIYVAADCNGNWVGPINFKTLCTAFDTFPFVETFNVDSTTKPCWTVIDANGDNDAWNLNGTYIPRSGQSAQLYTDYNTSNNDYLISPQLDLGTTAKRLKFWVRHNSNSEPDNLNVRISTTGNDVASFASNLLLTITTTQMTNVYTEYIVDLSAYSGLVYIAFAREDAPADGWYVAIDDVTVEDVPTVAPSCATNIVATPDVSCGNFANQITWDVVSGADGYYITIGTTMGGNDVADAVDLINPTYSFLGTVNTTYYYTVVPYNAFGPATGCVEQSFTTVATGCYCTSVPTSNDGSGITNVQIGTTNFPNGDVMYFDHTATPVDLAQGINANVQVSFATGYTYHTNIWIDFNDDYNFDASELVYQGESLATNPTTLNASFIMPAGAPLGTHRMRIGTADTGQATPNPCYSGSYGVTLDFAVNIVGAACTPPVVASTNIVPDCSNGQFNIAVDVTSLGGGTPVLTDGTNNWAVTTTGVVVVGPFTESTSVSIVLLHGSDTTCDLPLGNFTYVCPAVNDNLCDAISLTVNAVSTGTQYNNIGATAEPNEPIAGCFSDGINGSVWFSFVAPASGEVIITTDIAGASATDTEIALYDATGVTCSDLSTLGAPIACDQDGGTTIIFNSIITQAGLTPGNTYYIQVDDYGWGTTQGSFGIEVQEVLSSDLFDNNNFTAYPNPVKDILNLSYTSEITSVRVINMLGQVVISRNLNANNAQVDMSQLSAGTYIVNVAIGDTIKTVKVVKQ